MKIDEITLTNFRSFSYADVVLNGKSAVFFGVNGVGKSSLLRAINLLYANIINNTVNRKELRQQYNIELDDIQHGSTFANIKAKFIFSQHLGQDVVYERGIDRRSGKRSHSKHSLDAIAAFIRESYISDLEQSNIPIFVNYGTNRLVLDIPLRIKTHHEFDIYSAYEKAIENRIDFRTFFEWYRNQEDAENAVKVEMKDFEYEDRSLSAIRRAIVAMLPEFSNIHIIRRPRLAMVVEKNGVILNISQLSDGEKCVLAMFGDLAKRLALANPKLDDPLKGNGVVLIDELELHMHPKWQRMILRVLKDTFPNVQFIVTTHSPVVLSEVDNNYRVFYMDSDGIRTTLSDFTRLDGYDINYILEEFMGTESKNIKTTALIRSIYQAIDQNDFVNAKDKIKELEAITSSINEDVITANMLILRKERKNDTNP